MLGQSSRSYLLSAAILSCISHPRICTDVSTPLVFNVFPHVKPPWQSLNHFNLLLQTFGMHNQIIFRPFQLFFLLEELSNIYSCLLTQTVVQNLVRSNQPNVSHFVIQGQLLPSHSPEIQCCPFKVVPSSFSFRVLAHSYMPNIYTPPHTVISILSFHHCSSQPSQYLSVSSCAYTRLLNERIEKQRLSPGYVAANQEPGFLTQALVYANL